MKEEGFIIPYTYHCMAMSCFADVLKEELGNDWQWAQLLPKHFDVCDPKGTPMFHKGIHVPCYCLPNLWPVISRRGTEDDLKRCKVILLFTRKSRNKPASLAGFVEVEKIKGPFYIRESRIDERSPCIKEHCPNLVAGRCRKKSEASAYVMYRSVYIIDPEAVKDRKNLIHPLCGRWETSKPENSVKERQNELLEIYEEARENTREVKSPGEWCRLIKEIAGVLHRHGVLRYLYNRERIRDIWRFAGILKIIEDTLRGVGCST